jgi:hypothetical protein
VEEKKKYDSEFLSYNLMLYSGKNSDCATKKINILSLVGRSLRQTAIQNAVTVESMVWNVLSLALNAEEIHVATCLHAKIRTLIQTNSLKNC